MRYIKRLFQEPARSYFLFGARGTGKSTYMKTFHPDALWIDLLRPQVLRTYLARPERLYDLVANVDDKTTLIIDEIQKAPSLLTIIHSLIEEKRGLKFILTGSSARKIKRVGADLLGGRVSKCSLHPFMAVELGKAFSLETALKQGLLPLVQTEKDPIEVLHGYVNLYLQEEIQAEGLVRNLENFSRFLEVISFSHGAVLNVNNIARECEIKRKTVENYIQILKDLLLGFEVSIFTKRTARAVSAHPKFYLFDSGVFQCLRPKGPLDKTEEINGAALEGIVAQHLRAWNDYSIEKNTIHFWRTRSGLEVDFIVYGSQNFWAIEVKNSKHVHSQDLKSLKEFLKDYPEAKGLLLYRGTETLTISGILCLPCDKFLLQLTPNKNIVVS
jgi:predicted AAA+ superfamily ATPase